MCVASMAAEPYPATTNVGLGQCAGAEGAGAELRMFIHRLAIYLISYPGPSEN
jgi:hypothetical protein